MTADREGRYAVSHFVDPRREEGEGIEENRSERDEARDDDVDEARRDERATCGEVGRGNRHGRLPSASASANRESGTWGFANREARSRSQARIGIMLGHFADEGE